MSERRASILRALRRSETITAQALADRFGVALRTIYRDIDVLRAQGAIIVGVAGEGYHLEPGTLLAITQLAFTEIDALVAAAEAGISSLPECLQEAAHVAVRRARAATPWAPGAVDSPEATPAAETAAASLALPCSANSARHSSAWSWSMPPEV